MSDTGKGAVLVTGAATGIGRLTATTLAHAGYDVYASMRDVEGRNSEAAQEFSALAKEERLRVSAVELDVSSQESADAAVERIVEESGSLEIVVHNAGHLYVGYTEAFTAEDIGHLVDVNAIGAHRVNRAALPHMREAEAGSLIYIGSTILVTTPPFLGPYVASKAAFDALAVVTSYEVSRFGIETTIVMPGAITQGTNHFAGASHASDEKVTEQYAPLDELVARTNEAHEQLFDPGATADPQEVADEVERVLGLAVGTRPFRTVVDAAHAGVDHVMAFSDLTRRAFVTRLGFPELLEVNR